MTKPRGRGRTIDLRMCLGRYVTVELGVSHSSFFIQEFNFSRLSVGILILLFMMLKAGLIIAVFMHMKWERLALSYAILLPPVLVLVFVGIMVLESDYTLLTRVLYFAAGE